MSVYFHYLHILLSPSFSSSYLSSHTLSSPSLAPPLPLPSPSPAPPLPLPALSSLIQCKLDLKTYELVYHDVRVVVPHLECTLHVEYDQFSTCGDILRQVLEAAEPDPAMRDSYNLFHVRLRQR